jgi:hypothetical protein
MLIRRNEFALMLIFHKKICKYGSNAYKTSKLKSKSKLNQILIQVENYVKVLQFKTICNFESKFWNSTQQLSVEIT